MRTLVERRRLILIVGLIVLAIAGLFVWRVVHHRMEAAKAAAAGPPPVPVVTTEAVKEEVPIYLTGIGSVVPAQSVTVKVRVDGQLDKITFTEGQDVKQGDLLAQIDPRPLQAQVDQAEVGVQEVVVQDALRAACEDQAWPSLTVE